MRSPPQEFGTEVVVESTANGAAGWFYERYTAAKKGLSSDKAHFFSCLQQPEYSRALDPGEVVESANGNDREQELVERHGATPEQLKWYRAKVADKGSADLVDQEYPTDEETCWITPGRTFFNKVVTKKLLAKTEPPLLEEQVGLDGAFGTLRIWDEPKHLVEYLVIVDPSEGVGGDPGAAVVYERATGIHVATLHGQFPTWEHARLVAELGTRYNTALVVVERNNHGHAVLQALDKLEAYPNIYEGEDERPGWVNSTVSRAAALDALENAHRKGEWSTRDRASLEEFLLFIVINRKPQAGPGAHDDLLIAHAIANDVLSHPVSSGASTVVGTGSRWGSDSRGFG